MITLLVVHKFSKRFFVPAVGLVLVAILVALDLYAGSKNVKTRMETALERELNMPVQFGAVHYTLWGGLRATDASIEVGTQTEGAAASTLTIPSVSAHLAWYPLFSGRLVVQKLIFKTPQLTWVQGADGRWNLPAPKPPQAKPAAPRPPEPKEKRAARKRLEFGIEAVKVENARLQFIDRQGRPTATFEGVNLYMCDPEKPEGTLAIEKTSLREGLTVERFAAPFELRKKHIAISPIDARVAQGSVRGSATLGFERGLPLFTLDLLFDGVSLNELLTQFGNEKTAARTDGTLQGNLDLYGTVGQKKSIEGAGQLRLLHGRMNQVPLLQTIGKALQIEELNELDLRNVQLNLRAAEGKVFVDNLTMESLNMGLTAEGVSEWDGKLNLAARLAVAPKITRQLPGWVDAGFQPVPGGDFRQIAFNINGTVTNPNTDLLCVLMGQKYGTQFLNLWQSLSGKNKKKGEEKKKPELPANEEGDPRPPAR